MPVGESDEAISKEIAHLIRDKNFSKDRAVAAAFAQAGRSKVKGDHAEVVHGKDEKPAKKAAPTGSGKDRDPEHTDRDPKKSGVNDDRPLEEDQMCPSCGDKVDKWGRCPACDGLIDPNAKKDKVSHARRRPVTDLLRRYQRAGYSIDDAVRAVIHLRRMRDRGMKWDGRRWVPTGL